MLRLAGVRAVLQEEYMAVIGVPIVRCLRRATGEEHDRKQRRLTYRSHYL